MIEHPDILLQNGEIASVGKCVFPGQHREDCSRAGHPLIEHPHVLCEDGGVASVGKCEIVSAVIVWHRRKALPDQRTRQLIRITRAHDAVRPKQCRETCAHDYVTCAGVTYPHYVICCTDSAVHPKQIRKPYLPKLRNLCSKRKRTKIYS